MHGTPPSRPRGCVQSNYQQLIPNLQFTYCIMQKLHEWSKQVLWQRFWLDWCTKQVVSAKACACQFLPYNSSGIRLSGKNCADRQLLEFWADWHSFYECGGSGRGVWGGPKLTRDCHELFFDASCSHPAFFLLNTHNTFTRRISGASWATPGKAFGSFFAVSQTIELQWSFLCLRCSSLLSRVDFGHWCDLRY